MVLRATHTVGCIICFQHHAGVAGLYLFRLLKRTRLGKEARALSQNYEGALVLAANYDLMGGFLCYMNLGHP